MSVPRATAVSHPRSSASLFCGCFPALRGLAAPATSLHCPLGLSSALSSGSLGAAERGGGGGEWPGARAGLTGGTEEGIPEELAVTLVSGRIRCGPGQLTHGCQPRAATMFGHHPALWALMQSPRLLGPLREQAFRSPHSGVTQKPRVGQERCKGHISM